MLILYGAQVCADLPQKKNKTTTTTTKHLSLLTFAYGHLDKTLSNFFQIHLAHVVSF